MSSIHRLDAHYDVPQTVLRRCTLLSRSVQNDQRRARFSEQSSATNCHSELHACMPLVLQSRYIQVSQRAATNTEVAAVLRDMCVSLERFCSQEESQACRTTRQSIVDLGVMMIMRPRTIRSSGVYGRAHVQRTQMVDCFQDNVLDRTKMPSKQKRRHTCTICRGSGHHPQTCKLILASDETERVNLNFKKARPEE